ncbi:MAG: flavin-dependent oxidoreductase [SAR86 cluster bacterium]|uniref:Flavin-dependent oxidoreductase n=1 Tax=SAR86 cluster bacterium TaxID=2030880 RepID=A0A2A5CCY9_9GAMM|nr:MAG: flavin-dependent oxidoreductase [SAR86 cluster bacterium]
MNSGMENKPPILISGGGIGGLSFALTLHQLGVPCLVLEAAEELRPLGVGLNLQPNAVRELYELGISETELDSIGIQTKEWALVGLNGKEVYSEPRGLDAGYKWPQFSVHRGKLQMLLYEKVIERLGPEVIRLGRRVTGYQNNNEGVTAFFSTATGEESSLDGSLLVAADGIHSVIRAQMYPDQAPIHWGGAIMWRGTTTGVPIRTGASFIGLGSHDQRVVFYPISQPDSETGLATINWIAEITVDNSAGWGNGDWNKKVNVEDFIHHFKDWNYDWIDIPAMLRQAQDIYEYPMIDRDPAPCWVDDKVALLGDAAHVMYPTGSNGASQAIVDARVLGAALIDFGVSSEALDSYNEKLCKVISDVVLRNRGAGPFVILNELYDRCEGVFDDIEKVFPKADRDELMSRYKSAAGFAVEQLNTAASIIAQGTKFI